MKKWIIVVLFLFVLVGCETATNDNDDTDENVRLTFVVNGGTPVAPIEQEAGSDVVAPTSPTKDGYIFDGWYIDASYNTQFTFNTMPISNMILYAKWNEVSEEAVVLSFDSNGGSFVSSISNEPGSSIVEPNAPTRDGYTFDAWYEESVFITEFTFDEMPSEDTTLYAKWVENEENIVTITFNSNGGSNVSSIAAEVGTTVSEPTDPTKNGYSFEGWYEDTGLTTPFTFNSMPADDVTVYAKWVANQAMTTTITFNSNGGSSVSPITEEPGTTIASPTDPTKNGYSFEGWYLDTSLTTAFSFDAMPGTDLTLYAKWEEVIDTATITFNTNGGTSVSPITADVGSSISAPTDPTKSGYLFAGWYTNSSLTNAYSFSTMPSSNITLYAKWDQDNTVVNDLITLLESSGWDFECTGNVCVYEQYSWLTYTFDLNNVTFTREIYDNDSTGDEETKFETVVIDSSWSIDYDLEINYLNYDTVMRVSGNGQTGTYNVTYFNSDNRTRDAVYDDDAYPHITDAVSVLQFILDDAEITLGDIE